MELLIDGHHGIYIPQLFCQFYADRFKGIDKEDIDEIMKGSNNEWYWEAWDNILNSAYIVQDGKKYFLYQDMDLFLIVEDEEVNQC